jgi:hypothetical protein
MWNDRVCKDRTIARGALVALLLATPQAAQADSEVVPFEFLDTCMELTDLNHIQAALGEMGWVAAPTTSPSLVSGLAWIGATSYFTTDSGGELVESVLELKTKSAEGLLRKKDIPQSKNRYFLRQSENGEDVLHVMWRKPVPSMIEVECRAALLPTLAYEILRAELGTLSTFARIQSDVPRMTLTLLNASDLAEFSPPDAILTTYRQVKTEKVTQ